MHSQQVCQPIPCFSRPPELCGDSLLAMPCRVQACAQAASAPDTAISQPDASLQEAQQALQRGERKCAQLQARPESLLAAVSFAQCCTEHTVVLGC